MISNIYGQIFAIRYYYFVYTTWKVTIFSNSTLHCIEDRGAFCQFPFWWIYYCHSSESTGKETGKKHLCALLYLLKYSTYTFQLKFENTLVSLDRLTYNKQIHVSNSMHWDCQCLAILNVWTEKKSPSLSFKSPALLFFSGN